MFVIVVPYRNRKIFLDIFLEEIPKYIKENHGLLPDGKTYKIIISEQNNKNVFNLSLSRNCGAIWSNLNFDNISHFIFNDVDAIPIKNIDYLTSENIINFINYGSCKINKNDFFKINGYNILYNGWGCEDVDLNTRLKHFKINFKKENFITKFIKLNNKYICIKQKYEINNATKVKYYKNELFLSEPFRIYEDLESNNIQYFCDKNLISTDKWRIDKNIKKNKILLKKFQYLNEKEKILFSSRFGINCINSNIIKLHSNYDDFIYHIKFN
jgi:hypothetical protein